MPAAGQKSTTVLPAPSPPASWSLSELKTRLEKIVEIQLRTTLHHTFLLWLVPLIFRSATSKWIQKTLSLLYWFLHSFCKVMLVKEFSFLSSFVFQHHLLGKSHMTQWLPWIIRHLKKDLDFLMGVSRWCGGILQIIWTNSNQFLWNLLNTFSI